LKELICESGSSVREIPVDFTGDLWTVNLEELPLVSPSARKKSPRHIERPRQVPKKTEEKENRAPSDAEPSSANNLTLEIVKRFSRLGVTEDEVPVTDEEVTWRTLASVRSAIGNADLPLDHVIATGKDVETTLKTCDRLAKEKIAQLHEKTEWIKTPGNLDPNADFSTIFKQYQDAHGDKNASRSSEEDESSMQSLKSAIQARLEYVEANSDMLDKLAESESRLQPETEAPLFECVLQSDPMVDESGTPASSDEFANSYESNEWAQWFHSFMEETRAVRDEVFQREYEKALNEYW
jgi:hypothetical protein